MDRNEEVTINTTLKLKAHNVVEFENWLKNRFTLISFEHVRNTDALYKNDPIFKKLVQEARKNKNIRLDYIIKNNHKYNE